MLKASNFSARRCFRVAARTAQNPGPESVEASGKTSKLQRWSFLRFRKWKSVKRRGFWGHFLLPLRLGWSGTALWLRFGTVLRRVITICFFGFWRGFQKVPDKGVAGSERVCDWALKSVPTYLEKADSPGKTSPSPFKMGICNIAGCEGLLFSNGLAGGVGVWLFTRLSVLAISW